MSDSETISPPHSSEYFGEERDYFWNADYLDLLARRLGLGTVSSLADIGCGIGHWSWSLTPRLARQAVIVGVDRDAENIQGYRRGMVQRIPNHQITGLEADASALPLPDAGFDAVTCQTLLIHLPDPIRALREMTRITRDNGLVLCAEPNNLIGRFPPSWFLKDAAPEALSRLSEMVWRYALGRERRGLGREWLGELLPGLFSEAGLTNIRVWLCDRTLPMIPPYATPAERAQLAALDRWRSEGTGPFDRQEARANVLAGDGTEAFFNLAWSDYLEQDRRVMQAIHDGRWHGAGGGLFYIVAGTVPER
jgi:SAM-dependent methyltransferase